MSPALSPLLLSCRASQPCPCLLSVPCQPSQCPGVNLRLPASNASSGVRAHSLARSLCQSVIIVALGPWRGLSRASRVGTGPRGARGRGARPQAGRRRRCRSTPRSRSRRGRRGVGRGAACPCGWPRWPVSRTASRCTPASPWRWSVGSRPPPPCHCPPPASTPSL